MLRTISAAQPKSIELRRRERATPRSQRTRRHAKIFAAVAKLRVIIAVAILAQGTSWDVTSAAVFSAGVQIPSVPCHVLCRVAPNT